MAEKPKNKIYLSFDRGTLLLRMPGDAEDKFPEIHDQFVWDDRVDAWRGQALSYGHVKRQLGQHGDLVETVFKLPKPLGRWVDIPLRPYQEAALVSWESNGRHGIIGLPTGAGKTRVALAAIASTGVPTLCMVPTRVLLDQWSDALQEFYQGPVGIIGDGRKRVELLTVSTFESAYRNMSWLGNRFQMIVVDEVHHFGRSLKDEALVMSGAPWRLGLTATKPDDSEQLKKLNELIGPVIYELGVQDLKGKYLADFEIFRIPLQLNQIERLRYGREYDVFKIFFRAFIGRNPGSEWNDFIRFAGLSEQGRKAISAFHRSRQICSLTSAKRTCLEKILQRHEEQKILIFTGDSNAAIKISRDYLIPALTAEISRNERTRVLADFKEERIRAIVACRVLNEGVDVPDAQIAIIMGGSANGREHVQRIGRLLRPKIGKKAIIYELIASDTHEVRHSKERSKPLATTKPISTSINRSAHRSGIF